MRRYFLLNPAHPVMVLPIFVLTERSAILGNLASRAGL